METNRRMCANDLNSLTTKDRKSHEGNPKMVPFVIPRVLSGLGGLALTIPAMWAKMNLVLPSIPISRAFPIVGLWRSWERASMAWKRSSVRSRPGPPFSMNSSDSRRYVFFRKRVWTGVCCAPLYEGDLRDDASSFDSQGRLTAHQSNTAVFLRIWFRPVCRLCARLRSRRARWIKIERSQFHGSWAGRASGAPSSASRLRIHTYNGIPSSRSTSPYSTASAPQP